MIVFRSAAEARQQLYQLFQSLPTASWRIRSPYDTSYKCIAWAACRTNRVWWPWDHPACYWPSGFRIFPTGDPVPVNCFVEMFEKKFGYMRCDNPNFEFGYQKVAIYANDGGATHMARQHFGGRGWLSKLGEGEDIVHEKLEDIQGDMATAAQQYGEVAQVLKRSWWTALLLLASWFGPLRWFNLAHPWTLTVKRIEFRSAGA